MYSGANGSRAAGSVCCIVRITCAIVSSPTTSAVRKVALLARPSRVPVRSSTTSKASPNLAASWIVASMPNTPTRFAMKFGVSLARTTPLPSVLVRKVSSWSTTSAAVATVGISSTRCM